MNTEHVNFIESVADSLFISGLNIPVDVCYWIGCQFALESSFGESSLAKSNFNYCGMKNPLVRFSCAVHSGDSRLHWAEYRSLAFCIQDYILCLQYHKPTSRDYDTIEHFARFISGFYCPEKDYISKINRIYKQLKIYKDGK